MAAGLAGGLALGLAAAWSQNPLLLGVARGLRPVGTLFLNLLSMVVIPLVTTALFAGIAGLGNLKSVGRLGLRTLAFFWGTTIAAIAIGLTVAALILPLVPVTAEQQATLREAARQDLGVVQRAVEQIPSGARFIVELIPTNPLRSAVEGNLLPVIVFVTFFAVAAAGLPDEKRRELTDLADVATQALIRIVQWVLLLAPLGILAVVASAVAQLGWPLVKQMAAFVAAVILGCLVFITAVYLPAVALIVRVPVKRYLKAALPSMAMGFSTTSSLVALPTMLDAAERDFKMSRTVAGFALPLGASMNRAGSALYQAVAVLFIARLYGVSFGFAEIFQAAAAVFLASLTVAAVPTGSVVSLAPAFTQTGLPLSAMTLLIGLDRVPDMFRTMTNVTGHLTGAAVVAAVEGEKLE